MNPHETGIRETASISGGKQPKDAPVSPIARIVRTFARRKDELRAGTQSKRASRRSQYSRIETDARIRDVVWARSGAEHGGGQLVRSKSPAGSPESQWHRKVEVNTVTIVGACDAEVNKLRVRDHWDMHRPIDARNVQRVP